jgi:2'-5' RNA ligase
VAVRWTRPETWHLTLQFLGEWPQARLQALQDALGRVPAPAAFAIEPGGLGAFPGWRRPRVLFLQMDGDGQGARLARLLRESVALAWPEGPQDTRPYRGHLTLARVRDELDEDSLKTLKSIDLSGLPQVSVEGFSLVGSHLGAGAPQHRDLAFWRLRKKGE